MTSTKQKYVKPFLKWVGGKTQIIDDIVKYAPKEINNYHEIFLGGGSVLLAMLTLQREGKIKIGKIYAYDLNQQLINVYKHVQSNKDELFTYVNKYITEYDEIKGTIIDRKPKTLKDAKTSQESYYYWVRNKFNKMDKNQIEYSAIFMFLNKTCFRGLYREGPNGFNVPFGHYKKTPTIITKQDLDIVSDLIKDVVFTCSDFRDSLKNVKDGDYVYLDPPYAPKDKKSFVKYTNEGFNLESHEKLFSLIDDLNGIKFAMSNAKVDLVIEHFTKYKIEDIVARRSINSKNPGSKANEVIISNIDLL